MSAPTFNLIDEPWILVRRASGAVEEVSIRTALTDAGSIIDIVGEIPTQAFAILRLLLAILHRAVDGPQDISHWEAIRGSDHERLARVTDYLDEVHGRFDLRDAERPFFQVAGLTSAGGEPSGLEKLIADVPNNAPLFTTRLGPGLERISWAEAARWLIHVHAFDTSGIRTGAVGDPRSKGGKGYPIGTGWAGQIGGVHLVGTSLQETLLLNLVSTDDLDLAGGPDDLPPWERAPLGPGIEAGHGEEPTPTGPVDLYTWQSRRVRLIGDSDVTGLVLAQGDKMTPQNRHDAEPQTVWRYSEPQTKRFKTTIYMPRLHDPARSFWRGIAAVLPAAAESTSSHGPASTRPPAVMVWHARLLNEGLVPAAGLIRLHAVGLTYGAQNSTVEEIIDDDIVLPSGLLRSGAERYQLLVKDEIERAEATANALANLAANLALAGGADVTDGPRERVRERFYAEAEREFRQWLVDVSVDDDATASSARWQQLLRTLAENIADSVLANAGTTAWAGRESRGRHVDLGRSEVWFRRALRENLPQAFERATRFTDVDPDSREESHV